MEEHQIGEYKYDLQVPDLNSISFNNTRHTWRVNFLREVIRNGGIVWDLFSKTTTAAAPAATVVPDTKDDIAVVEQYDIVADREKEFRTGQFG